MRVLIATGVEEIDKSISAELIKRKIDVAGECYYREALLSLAQERRADIVIVSQHLPGEKEMIEVIKDLRMAGLRLILLPGRRDDESSLRLAGRAAALGVYDMIWDPVVPEKVAERVLNPATLAEAGVEPEGEAPVNVKPRKRNKSDKKESVYVVFGEHTEKVSNYLESRGYRVIGEDRTLDAAAIMALNLDERPDAYLILGSAPVCGAVDAGIEYGEALIESLKELKLAAPDSRIVLILPESVEPEAYQKILYMGIYDVHKTDSISMPQLPELLSVRKDATDFGLNTLPVPAGKSGRREIALKTRKKDKKSRVVFRALTALVRTAFEKAAFISRKSLELKIDAFRPAEGAGKAQEAAAESRPVKQEAPPEKHFREQEPSKDEKEKFQYELSPVGNSVKISVEEKALPEVESKAGGWEMPDSGARSGRRGKTVALCSPWIAGGTSAFIVLLSSHLSGKGKVAVVDCDLLEGYDRDDIPALLAEKAKSVRWLLLDIGDNPDSRAFRKAAGLADVLLWVVRDPFWEQAKVRWKDRPKIRCREVMILFGPGDPLELEDVFVIPCFQVKSLDDTKGVERLMDVLNSSSRGPRVLLVGFPEIPEIPDFTFDSFQTAEEAMKWIEYNPPDAAVLCDNLRNLSLIEYDLIRYNIPVEKTDSSKLCDVLKHILR